MSSIHLKVSLYIRGKGGRNAAGRGVEWKAANLVEFGSARDRERSSAGRTGIDKADRKATWRTIEAIGLEELN